MASATVTIDKIYFETLLRKANVHGSGPAFNGPPGTDSIAVAKDYHDELVRSVREYHALRNSLIRGGVTVENLELLINAGLEAEPWAQNRTESYPSAPHSSVSSEAGVPLPPIHTPRESSAIQIRPPPLSSTSSFRTQPEGDYTDVSAHGSPTNGHSYRGDRTPDDYAASDTTTKQGDYGFKKGYEYRNGSAGNRTLFFSKLSVKTTYASLLEVVRGGAVVDAWMKPSDHCASISFVEPDAAENFYRYAKKNDIYIDGRRINVEWREPARQFVVLPNILRQIHTGATRNLLLRNIPPTLTEARLLDDLDHIANLSVEKIVFDRAANSVQVNLNSVCVACFARTCLKSRAYYKGIKIDFGIDECAKRLPDFKAYRKDPPKKNFQEKKIANRFDALALDGNDNDEDLWEQSNEESEIPEESWADSVSSNPTSRW